MTDLEPVERQEENGEIIVRWNVATHGLPVSMDRWPNDWQVMYKNYTGCLVRMNSTTTAFACFTDNTCIKHNIQRLHTLIWRLPRTRILHKTNIDSLEHCNYPITRSFYLIRDSLKYDFYSNWQKVPL